MSANVNRYILKLALGAALAYAVGIPGDNFTVISKSFYNR